jgi:hypothetical protein
VRVTVQRQRHIRMPEYLLHDSRRDARFKRPRCECVSERMEIDVLDSRFVCKRKIEEYLAMCVPKG